MIGVRRRFLFLYIMAAVSTVTVTLRFTSRSTQGGSELNAEILRQDSATDTESHHYLDVPLPQHRDAPKPDVDELMTEIPVISSTPETNITWLNFFEYIEEAAGCKSLKTFGGVKYGRSRIIDGEKAVCLDANVAPTPGSCTVLSFGINNEWSFDDAMEEYGCKVYAFDPSMRRRAHLRRHKIHFQPWGLGGATGQVTFRNNKTPIIGQVYTYRDVLKKINESNSVIDYLKIDIEGSEVDFFNNVLSDDVELLANVKQIGMEIHPGRSTTSRDKIWSQIRQLRSLHFLQVFSQPNLVARSPYEFYNKTVSCCYEILWVNEKFL
ncbi:uncharacterized protein LOC108674871 [Hyalella azteca]|uniref:Uncharacterized protein LOC108674871 n=1 Tax=Hyalella azteca TaxID=294128 RepID=A0A8B7NX18_HYAAZ|nr:uncharacterized protein LOC108674871 [Hyalella azteca]